MRILVAFVALALAGSTAGGASATFAGGNGQIGFHVAEHICHPSGIGGCIALDQDGIWTVSDGGSPRLVVAHEEAEGSSGGFGVFTTLWASEPQFSPDGTRLAFTGADAEIKETIWVSDLEGGDRIPIAAGSSPTWSPDSRHLAFVREDRIFVRDLAAGGAIRRVASGARPHWSARGDLAFSRWTASCRNYCGAFVVPSGGGRVRRVAPNWLQCDDWSPEGRRLVCSQRGRTCRLSGLWTVDPSRATRRVIARGCYAAPAWSPDGQRLATVLESAGSDALSIVVLPRRGGKPLAMASLAPSTTIDSTSGDAFYVDGLTWQARPAAPGTDFLSP